MGGPPLSSQRSPPAVLCPGACLSQHKRSCTTLGVYRQVLHSSRAGFRGSKRSTHARTHPVASRPGTQSRLARVCARRSEHLPTTALRHLAGKVRVEALYQIGFIMKVSSRK